MSGNNESNRGLNSNLTRRQILGAKSGLRGLRRRVAEDVINDWRVNGSQVLRTPLGPQVTWIVNGSNVSYRVN